MIRWNILLLLLTSVSSSSYPDCSDPATYSSYGKSTEYKGLNSNTAWDRTFNTGDTCDFSPVVPSVQPLTCGDCDFDLENGTWYRFDQGPYVQIKEYSDKTSCPARGHCNGYYQIALVSSDIPSNNSQSKMYHIVYSNSASQTDCIAAGDEFMAEEFYCGEFVLYKFPVGWKSANTVCSDIKDTPTPYSFCMEDTVIELTLTANRKYFTKNEDVPLICSSTRSPTPPNSKITWTDQDNQNITSLATRDTANSSLFTAVYSLNSSASYTRVTCQVEDKSHTFYRVSLEASNVTGVAGKEVSATCKVTFDTFSSENEENLYLIKVLDDSEVYYTSQNISTKGDKMVIDKESFGTYRVTLILSNTTLSSNVRNQTENWKCGVRDPITKLYTTVPFIITINRDCTPGTGFVTSDSAECKQCPENTFSNQSICEDCPEGEISNSGADFCRDDTSREALYYALAGVGCALLVILALMIAALIWNSRREENNNIVITNPSNNPNNNPSNDNSRSTNKNSTV